ncbi:hypothetical protein CRUP_022929 [Coryphaenoides rupestris]|nr:hypothetical protein CRUP_022929 [Coryphaenoides rupestris]
MSGEEAGPFTRRGARLLVLRARLFCVRDQNAGSKFRRTRVQAIFSHAAGDNGTLLSFSEGDVITLLVPEARDGWHYGENEKNKMLLWVPLWGHSGPTSAHASARPTNASRQTRRLSGEVPNSAHHFARRLLAQSLAQTRPRPYSMAGFTTQPAIEDYDSRFATRVADGSLSSQGASCPSSSEANQTREEDEEEAAAVAAAAESRGEDDVAAAAAAAEVCVDPSRLPAVAGQSHPSFLSLSSSSSSSPTPGTLLLLRLPPSAVPSPPPPHPTLPRRRPVFPGAVGAVGREDRSGWWVEDGPESGEPRGGGPYLLAARPPPPPPQPQQQRYGL